MSGRVCVVGAGVIGLASAVNIVETLPGVEVTLVAETFSIGIASYASGGLWNGRDSLDGTALSRIQEWSRATWKFGLPLARSPEASKIGIEFIPGYRLYTELIEGDTDPWYKDDVIGLRRVSEREIRELFPDGTFRDGYSYVSLITNCPVLLQYLLDRFKKRGGKIEQRRVNSLEEFVGRYDVVVNCSGVGAGILARDKSLVPSRGQIVRVRAPMQHFFVMGYYQDASMKDKSFSLFPRNGEVLLGGNRQAGRWDMAPSEAESRDILERTSRVCPNLKGCEIIANVVGLRPSRPGGVRLEPETMTFGKGNLEVVHNYGHEGNGVTLHWGCAQDAAKLVRHALDRQQTPPSSRL